MLERRQHVLRSVTVETEIVYANGLGRLGLSSQVLLGLFLGIFCGLFFGEGVAFLEVAGRERALQLALTGGDDYALCFTLAPGSALPADCTAIGTVERLSAIARITGSGTSVFFLGLLIRRSS